MGDNPNQYAVDEVQRQREVIVSHLRRTAREIEQIAIEPDGPDYVVQDEVDLSVQVTYQLANLQSNVWLPVAKMTSYADIAVQGRRHADLVREHHENHKLLVAARQLAKTPTGKKAREELIAVVGEMDS